MKLKTHFALLVGATLIPAIVLAVVLVVVVHRQQRAEVEEGLRNTARALAVAVDGEFDSSIRALETLGASADLDRGDVRTFYEHARRARDANPRWLSVFLIDAAGDQVLSVLRPFGASLPRPEPWDDIQTVLRTGTPRVSDLAFGPLSQRHIIVVLVPVVRDGAVRYALGASIGTESLSGLLAAQVGATDSLAGIRDRKNVLVARSHDTQRYIGRPPDPDFLDKVQAARRTGAIFEATVSSGEPPRYVAVSPVGTSDFIVLVGVPATTLARHTRASVWVLAVGGGVILVMTLAVSTVLARRVAAPIVDLSRTAAQLARGEPIPEDRPSPVAEVATVRHAMARAAEALRERTAERERRIAAEEASRAKDQFLAALSHELRTPLTPVLAGISLLQKEETLSERAQEHLDVVRRNVELEARLIDDLLDLTRVAHGKVELDKRRVEVCTVIERAIEVCHSDIEARRLHFAFDRGPAPPYVIEADAARLQQVFWNLLKNSTKFTPNGGCVGIRCVPEDDHVVVEVADSGTGIPAADVGRIFDAFVQSQRPVPGQFGGLGLGLAISKALVESHGGRIEAHSEGHGTGAMFRVRLPMISAGTRIVSDHAAASSEGSEPATRAPLRILVVEDHGDTAEMIVEILELDGHAVHTAGDVAGARELIARSTFDLLLSDLGLPDGSGLDLLRDLRARGHMVPAVALSGYGMDRDIQRSRAAGFDAHVVKPIDVDRLLETIHTVAAVRRRA
jgi:signal transduction histidine kinase/ActR/RegA family two-component response regulator